MCLEDNATADSCAYKLEDFYVVVCNLESFIATCMGMHDGLEMHSQIVQCTVYRAQCRSVDRRKSIPLCE